MAKRSTASRSRATDNRTTDTSNTAQSTAVPFPDRRQSAVTETGENAAQPLDASSTGTRSDSMASEPSEEAIRLRAYQRYLARGGNDGMDFEDWLQAEQELRQGVKK